MNLSHSSLKTLQLKARQQVYSLLSGHHFSKLHAQGYDFSQLREYQAGDDIRKINWMITAKLGVPYIKELHANRELSVVVCTLMDASLYFGPRNEKQRKLTEVSAILAYATQKNADLFTGIAYTQEKIFSTPPTKQLYHIESFIQNLYEAKLLNSTLDKNLAIANLFKHISKPSLVFVLGDFLDEVNLSLLSQKHEVIAIIIRNRAEELLVPLGEVTLKNPHDSTTMGTYFGKRSIQKYLSKLEENEEKRKEHFLTHKIRSVTIYTDEEALLKLITLFL